MRGRLIRLGLAAIGLYFVWPALVKVFGSYHQLADIKPPFFVVMTVLEILSFASVWLLVGIANIEPPLDGHRDGAVRRQRRELGRAGRRRRGRTAPVHVHGEAGRRLGRGRVGARGYVPALDHDALRSRRADVPIVLRMQHIDVRLERAAVLGLIVFVLLLGLGVVAFTVDAFLRGIANAAQWARNKIRRKQPPTTDLADRVLEQRNRVRATLGRKWPWALVAAVSKWAFDYFALVAAVAATGAQVDPVPLMIAYVAASVLGMIPITPAGLGFVEAGLAVTLVWAGLPAAKAHARGARVPDGLLLAAVGGRDHRCRGQSAGRAPSPA